MGKDRSDTCLDMIHVLPVSQFVPLGSGRATAPPSWVKRTETFLELTFSKKHELLVILAGASNDRFFFLL